MLLSLPQTSHPHLLCNYTDLMRIRNYCTKFVFVRFVGKSSLENPTLIPTFRPRRQVKARKDKYMALLGMRTSIQGNFCHTVQQ